MMSPQLTQEQLIAQLAKYQDVKNPYKVTTSGNIVTIEIDLADAKWYTLFQKNGLKKTYKVVIELKDATKTAVVSTEEYELSWEAGIPKIGARLNIAKGKQFTLQYGAAAGIREDGTVGKVYEYSLNSVELLGKIGDIIKAAGWKQGMSQNQKGGLIVGIVVVVLLIVCFGIALLSGVKFTPSQNNGSYPTPYYNQYGN